MKEAVSFRIPIMENDLKRLRFGGNEAVAVACHQLHLPVGGFGGKPGVDTGADLKDDPWDDTEWQDRPPNLAMEGHLWEMMIIHGEA